MWLPLGSLNATSQWVSEFSETEEREFRSSSSSTSALRLVLTEADAEACVGQSDFQ